MADGVTKLGGGWDQAPQGTAEFALGQLLAAGALTGEDVITALKAQGFDARGPAYYPVQDGKGPFYALGNPHDYAALDLVDGVPQWDLINFDPSTVVLPPAPPAPPAPAPPASTADLSMALQIAFTNSLKGMGFATTADVEAARDAIIARIALAQEAIQQQIDQVVKNAETTMRALEPVVAAALPALSGLFTKTT